MKKVIFIIDEIERSRLLSVNPSLMKSGKGYGFHYERTYENTSTTETASLNHFDISRK